MESNKPTRRSLLGAIGGSLVLAGCVGGDDDNGDENGGADSDNGSAANGDENGTDQNGSENGTDNGMNAPTVTVTSHDEHGDILAGPDGLTLYMFDQDEQGAGESVCSGDCANAWPPLTVDGEPVAGDGVEGELTAFEREGGSTQVAANGWPLYYFANDEAPGDTNGQAVNDVWWVLGPDGTPVRDGGGDDDGGSNGDDNGGGSNGDDDGGYDPY